MNNLFFLYFPPLEGNFDIDAGDWGGPFRTPKISNNHEQIVRTKIVHTSVIFFKKMYNNTFKISSYIQKKTTTPIIAFKIKNYNTQHTNNTKLDFQKSNMFEHKLKNNKHFKSLFYYISNFHNSYSIYFLILYTLCIHVHGGSPRSANGAERR